MSEFERPLAGYRYVQIEYGDTLQKIALRELGDAARWVDIVNINNLVPPFLVADPAQSSTSVRAYGDALIVPASAAFLPNNAQPENLYETDCALVNGDIVDDGGGDVLTLTGRPNLRQAIYNRVTVAKYDLIFHPQYGCDLRRIIGTVNGPTASLLAARYVKQTLLADARIKTVDRINVTVNGDVIVVEAQVTPITGQILQINLEV